MNLKSLNLNRTLRQVLLFSVCFLVFFISCDRHVCENTNPIFDKYQPTSKEYKLELIKQLSIVDKSKLRYWLKDYTEYGDEVQFHFWIQSKELCAVLVLDVEQWGKLEQLREKKGKGCFNAEFTNLQFDIEQDSLNPRFIFKDFSRIRD